ATSMAEAAKVEEFFGVPPQRVVDVMALRGDSIDNIPGAPGIGDKGSVELIQRFGSLEAALDHAAEVERKTYRESLQNNREKILLSKQLVTIDCNVSIELDVEKMHAGEADVEALRSLFTELEFTSLLKELLPVVEAPAGNYREAKSAADLESLLKARSSNVPLAIAVESVVAAPAVEEQEEPDAIGLLPLQHSIVADTSKATTIALAVEPGSALTISADARADSVLKQGLADEKIPKAIHDWKTASHVLTGVELAGVEHDTRLYSYLLDPTYSSHRLPDLALRHFNLKLA